MNEHINLFQMATSCFHKCLFIIIAIGVEGLEEDAIHIILSSTSRILSDIAGMSGWRRVAVAGPGDTETRGLQTDSG